MGSISDIVNELHSVAERVTSHTEGLERAREEILEVRNKVHGKFGDDENGRSVAMAMDMASDAILTADGILYTLKAEIQEYIGNLKK